jgi:prepilin-type N-terminal cleavage/methylation domain-containing protein
VKAHRRKLGQRRQRNGFTLMESLMAAGILLVIVVAVTSAITAGQQNAFEAHQRIAATLAAEDLMGRLGTEPWDNLSAWNGYTEPVGTMTDIDGQPMPASFNMVGRQAEVTTTLKTLSGLGVNIRGRTVVIRAFDADGRILASISRFVPEPAS